jgi:chorismate mutase
MGQPIDKMIQSPEFIKEIGKRLHKIDGVLVSALAKRMELAKLVELWKHMHGDQPIIRREIEIKRLNEVAALAEAKGMNPDFGRTFLFTTISESCRVQIDQYQMRQKEDKKSQ